MTVILGIETSCDETAAAIVVDGRQVLANVVSSQVDLHARYGGVVPESAGRAHESLLTPVIAEAMVEAGVTDDDIDVVAATHGPGLIGSLLIGVSAEKALALGWGLPFIGINHHEALICCTNRRTGNGIPARRDACKRWSHHAYRISRPRYNTNGS